VRIWTNWCHPHLNRHNLPTGTDLKGSVLRYTAQRCCNYATLLAKQGQLWLECGKWSVKRGRIVANSAGIGEIWEEFFFKKNKKKLGGGVAEWQDCTRRARLFFSFKKSNIGVKIPLI